MKVLWNRLGHEWRLWLVALQFFTRVPVAGWPQFDPDWLRQCMRYFPLVGTLVGVWGCGVLAVASMWWPPSVAVGLSMAATMWLTGGFHEDGWADTCDGLGGAVTRERALTIMKDSRLGTYGALGLLMLLGLKAAVLIELLSPRAHELNEAQSSHIHQVLLGWTMMGLVWAHTLSRWMPVWLTASMPYAGDPDHAKAKPLALQASRWQVMGAGLGVIVVGGALWLLLGAVGWPVATLWHALWLSTLVAGVVAVWARRWFMARLGGFTGDTLGASQQLTELAVLLAWLTVVHPVA